MSLQWSFTAPNITAATNITRACACRSSNIYLLGTYHSCHLLLISSHVSPSPGSPLQADPTLPTCSCRDPSGTAATLLAMSAPRHQYLTLMEPQSTEFLGALQTLSPKCTLGIKSVPVTSPLWPGEPVLPVGAGFASSQRLHGLFQPQGAGGNFLLHAPKSPGAAWLAGCTACLPSPFFSLLFFFPSFFPSHNAKGIFFFSNRFRWRWSSRREGGTANSSCRPGAQRLGRQGNPAKGTG